MGILWYFLFAQCMLKNNNPFLGAPCTDAINSINYKTPQPHSTGALPPEAQHLLTLFAGGAALSAITDTRTKQRRPLKKGSIPVCIFPSQTKHAGRHSSRGLDAATFQRRKMLSVTLSSTSRFHLRHLFLWPAWFCISQESEAVPLSEVCTPNVTPALLSIT